MKKKKSSGISTSKKVSRASSRGKNWVMAVDPFSDLNTDGWIKLAMELAEKSGATLYGVFVLAPAGFNWTGEFSGPWLKKYRPLAEKKLAESFPGGKVRTAVINCRESGVRASVKELLAFAKKLKAEQILISTHARSGLRRLALGSFAETLMLMSRTPIVVFNPSRALPQRIERILVPTDLSKKSETYVNASADYAKALGAELILFYKQPDPLEPILQQGVYALGGGWVSVQSFMNREMKTKTKQMERLETAIRKKGIEVKHIMDSSPLGLVDAINETAVQQKVDLVTVLTEANAWSAALLVSVARGLVRTSSAPVLVRR
jgi:nucleotide-binding universal stress UspA family protein